jgi:hypothetical protein
MILLCRFENTRNKPRRKLHGFRFPENDRERPHHILPRIHKYALLNKEQKVKSMTKWIPCGNGFIEADVIRWKESVWEKRSRRRNRFRDGVGDRGKETGAGSRLCDDVTPVRGFQCLLRGRLYCRFLRSGKII